MDPYWRFENVEFPISVGFTGVSIKFPDIPLLRSDTEKDVVVRMIKVYPFEVTPVSFQQNPVITTAQCQLLYLNLYVSGENSINQIPLPDLMTQYHSATTTTPTMWVPEETRFEDLQIDWVKSFIQFAGPLTLSADSVIQFGISYRYYAAGTMAKRRALTAAVNAQGAHY
jgi:hypothetical protein